MLSTEQKVCKEENCLKKISEWKRNDFNIVVIEGCFDILHYNHFRAMEMAKNISKQPENELSTKLIIRVFSDLLISQRPEKDPRGSILSLEERMLNLSHISHVDLITPKNNISLEWIRSYEPDFIIRSTTTGAKKNPVDVVNEFEKFISLWQLKTKVIILNEHHQIVSKPQARLEANLFTEKKSVSGKISSSEIKKRIVNRGIKDVLLGTPDSLKSYLGNIYDEQILTFKNSLVFLQQILDKVSPSNEVLYSYVCEDIKSKESWITKAVVKYKGNYRLITDNARSTILVKNEFSARCILNLIMDEVGYENVEFTDNFTNPNILGFRQLNTSLILPNSAIGEIQIHTPLSIYSRGADRQILCKVLGEELLNSLEINKLNPGMGHTYHENYKNLLVSIYEKQDIENLLSIVRNANVYHDKLFALSR